MSQTKPTGAPAPLTTSSCPFFSCNPEKQKLFSVAPGVSIIDALETASCLLAEIMQASAKTDEESPFYWWRAYLVEAVKAIVDSSVQSLMDAEANAREVRP
jgi:hypothetical protein